MMSSLYPDTTTSNSDNNNTFNDLQCQSRASRGENEYVGPGEEGLVLKKALVLFRHGARTPLFTIPNIPQATYEADKYIVDMKEVDFDYEIINAQTKGPRPFSKADTEYNTRLLKGGSVSGQLTLLGQQQIFSLGQVLKKDYVHHHKLIDQEYNKDQIFLKSTNIRRTVKSLCSLLAGLFGVESLKKRAPIQIPVSEEINEVLIPNPGLCHNLQIYHLRAQNNADSPSGTLQDRLFIEKCIGINSEDVTQQIKWIECRDDLVARQVHNFEVPKEFEPHMEMIAKNATMQLYYSVCGQTEKDTEIACTLSCGKALHMFLEHLKMDTDEGGYQLYLYSCHDSTLTALLGAFDIFDCKFPPFAADLRIELYENSESQQFIKVSYLGKNMITRGCTEIYSPYETFVKGISRMVVNADSHAAACCCPEIEKLAQGNNIIDQATLDAEKMTKGIGV